MKKLKILMATMSMDIGGAETHILELSKALQKKGHTVTVTSNGGVYVEELEKNGISHVKLPLHNKRISSVIKGYLGLYRLIKAEQFDVVHAHARIPAFLCGLLRKRLHFRFVTTAHLGFSVNLLWKKIADWGDRTLAVSEDIKDYLIDNYGVMPDNIDVTINGIDRKKFSASTDTDEIEREFGLERNKRRLVYISRIDHDRSAVAFMLVDIAQQLWTEVPELEMVIVGGGDDFARLQSEAEKANKAIGHRVIKLTGSRTDINRFIAYSEVFVGVSRSALEAMSAEKPVIVAGNEGYIGFFEESRLQEAVSTNFCCRGCGMATPEKLYGDVLRALRMSEEERSAAGAYNSALVEKQYSVEQMANDAEEMYQKVLYPVGYRHGDVVLCGYYGYGNLGDESLLQTIIASLRKEDSGVKITVLSKTPQLTARTYSVHSIGRYNLWQIASAFRHGKVLVAGGGSLLQNSTSDRSLFYYRSVMERAKEAGMKLMLYAGGIGPVSGEQSREQVRKLLEKADVISLREEMSFRDMTTMGVKNPRAYVSADPAFCIEPAPQERVAYLLSGKSMDTEQHRYFAVSVREWSRSDPAFEEKLARICLYIIKKHGYYPVFVSMQQSKDTDISDRIRSKILAALEGEALPAMPLIDHVSASELIGILGKTEFVIGMRLHALIYGAVAGIPLIGLSYDPKVTAVMDVLGEQPPVYVEELDEDAVCRLADEAVAEKDALTASMKEKVAQMRKRCQKDAENAIGLLQS